MEFIIRVREGNEASSRGGEHSVTLGVAYA
jgi:hypothetical protein